MQKMPADGARLARKMGDLNICKLWPLNSWQQRFNKIPPKALTIKDLSQWVRLSYSYGNVGLAMAENCIHRLRKNQGNRIFRRVFINKETVQRR